MFRPQDKSRLWYLLLLFLFQFYNITGGLFPDPKIDIPISTQVMIAYGSGFLMASFFPFYFYKAFELKLLRWHALYGVPLFLMLPYFIFFVIVYAINGKLNVDIKFGMIVPLIYALVLLWVMFKAIRKKYETDRNKNEYLEEIAIYCAVIPWISLTFFGLVEESQLIEVLFTNTGFTVITIIFITKSVKRARLEYKELLELNMVGLNSETFEINCQRYQLTKRQVEIVLLLRRGHSYKNIAEGLFISEKTVNNHIQNIYEKIGASNKVELIYKLANRA
ncbi:LuxR C-terminal-related transcriptional regulator [Mucilaginibacter sp. L3T2-6]|uniref:response regulator transcription factor n=1 Tax=Mucilaginibacter sp. L3T2-6 TaxID=3062491 RepID=UPI0026F4C3B2|nr:LuxR C-terminal-related transcriptional regulator [Mucilaginibacter sp. L3T2-6]MDO3641526.1 LuxR C-terminal-related transcriptional regulator [Mucilaginibacter sp. L3T2-6]MDV6213713.1 LuxR C-terminal-related transcriptional regulator [Mucilaginibacter sp. L3T2-6]